MKMNLRSEKKNKLWYARAGVTTLLLVAVLAGCAPPATPEAPTPVPPTTAPPTSAATAAVVDPSYYENQPVAVLPDGEPGQPMVTAAYNTTIRGGPGTNYVTYGAFLGSDTAIAVGTSSDSQWYVVSVPVAPGGIGWVSAQYVLPENTTGLPVVASPPVPPTVELVPPQPEDPQATSLTEVYVRTGPGEDYPAYGIAKTGATVRVVGKSEDGQWLTVRLNPQIVGAGYGWVSIHYVQPANIESVPVVVAPEQAPPVSLPPPAAGVPQATAIDYVNLRSGPGTNYLILGVASPGGTGEVIGKSEDGGWWQVKVPVELIAAGVAWVSAGWVTTANTDSVPVVAAPPPPPEEISTAPPPDDQCVLISQSPADYTVFGPSTSFDVEWVLQNTSDSPWGEGEVDLAFAGAIDGVRLHQHGDLYDITQTVQPGENYTISGSLFAPAEPGQYGEAWVLQQGQNTLCTFWIVVEVQ
jgi:uncharacterized protein YraI